MFLPFMLKVRKFVSFMLAFSFCLEASLLVFIKPKNWGSMPLIPF